MADGAGEQVNAHDDRETGQAAPPPVWWRDRWLGSAVALGLGLRAILLLTWPFRRCIADECAYLELAGRIATGQGLAATDGWLWAPGYPHLLAAIAVVFGSPLVVRWLQVALALASIVLVFHLAGRLAGAAAGRAAALLYAVHPTLIFFTGRVWSETVYSTLILAGVAALAWCRVGGPARAIFPGALAGALVLMRGTGTMALPLLCVGAGWPAGDGDRARWKHALLLGVTALVVVIPYSWTASRTHGGFMVTDATLGRMMWLGNNDFPPRSFDYRSAVAGKEHYRAAPGEGWSRCATHQPPVVANNCDVRRGVRWIAAHPADFLRRIPYRAAQLLNPNSFLTRHLRWGLHHGTPAAVVEILVVAVAATSFIVLLGGTVGAWGWARGPTALVAIGVTLSHVLIVCLLAGLTRYRLAWEPIWIAFAGGVLARPRATWETLRASPWRLAGAVLSGLVLLPTMLWFLPTGWAD